MRHELRGHLRGKRAIESAMHVNFGQFAALAGEVDLELGALLRERSRFRIGLRMHGNVFSGRHGHRPGDQRRGAAQQDIRLRRMRRGNTQDQAGGGNDAVVGSQDAGA